MKTSDINFSTMCSALIYGRTYEVDHRWLATPNDFSQEDKSLALRYIEVVSHAHMTHYSAKPPLDLVSWLFWSNRRYSVSGILCNVSVILDEAYIHKLGKDLSYDNQTRRIPYSFLGYVFKKTDGFYKTPSIYPELNLFQPLCEYISEKWFDKYTKPPLEIQYKSLEELNLSNVELAENNPEEDLRLNLNPDAINFYPKSERYIHGLVNLNSRCERPTSLLIGSFSKNLVPVNTFLNVVVPDVSSPEVNSDDVFPAASQVTLSIDTLSRSSKPDPEVNIDLVNFFKGQAPWDTADKKVIADLTLLIEKSFKTVEELVENQLNQLSSLEQGLKEDGESKHQALAAQLSGLEQGLKEDGESKHQALAAQLSGLVQELKEDGESKHQALAAQLSGLEQGLKEDGESKHQALAAQLSSLEQGLKEDGESKHQALAAQLSGLVQELKEDGESKHQALAAQLSGLEQELKEDGESKHQALAAQLSGLEQGLKEDGESKHQALAAQLSGLVQGLKEDG